MSKVMGSMPFVVNTLGAQHANLLGDLELTQLLVDDKDTPWGDIQIRVCTIVCKIYIYIKYSIYSIYKL